MFDVLMLFGCCCCVFRCSKKMLLERLPPTITFQLKRFSQNALNKRWFKMDSYIAFPIDGTNRIIIIITAASTSTASSSRVVPPPTTMAKLLLVYSHSCIKQTLLLLRPRNPIV